MNTHSPSPATSRREKKNGLGTRLARGAAVITVTAAAALLATACGGSPASGGAPHATNSPSLVNYARCMRSHGVLNFPDPSGGQIPGGKTTLLRLSQTNPRFNAAHRACHRLWPYQEPTQLPQGQQLTYDLKFAQCMRSHGVPNFPDPTNGPHGLVFALSASRLGMDPHSLLLLDKAHQCLHVLPAGSSLPPATPAP